MSRDFILYLEDILQSIQKIEGYTKNLSYGEFAANPLIVDAVTRNLLVIGEAAKNIPPEVKKKHPKIEWKKISGLRDILAHEYFGVNLEIIWDIVANKLPELKRNLLKLRN